MVRDVEPQRTTHGCRHRLGETDDGEGVVRHVACPPLAEQLPGRRGHGGHAGRALSILYKDWESHGVTKG